MQNQRTNGEAASRSSFPQKDYGVNYLYFIRIGGAVKVGYSAFPGDRIKAILGENYSADSVLACVRGDLAAEKKAHERMRQIYGPPIKGDEWFSVSDGFAPLDIVDGPILEWRVVSRVRRHDKKPPTIALTDGNHDKLKVLSAKTGMKIGAMVNQAIAAWLGNQNEVTVKR